MTTDDAWAAEVAAAVPVALARWFTAEEQAGLVDIPVIAVDDLPDGDWDRAPRRLWGKYLKEVRSVSGPLDEAEPWTREYEVATSRRILISRAILEDCPDPEVRKVRLDESLYHEFAHAMGWHHGGTLRRGWGESRSLSATGQTDWTVNVQ